MITAISRGVEFLLQENATSGNGNAVAIPPSAKKHVINARGTGTIASGVISIEEADNAEYAGTWSVIQTINAVDLTGGADKAVHIDSIISAIRARISTPIGGGGSVTVGIKSF